MPKLSVENLLFLYIYYIIIKIICQLYFTLFISGGIVFVNYESELQSLLIQALSNLYGVKKEVVYTYFQIRFRVSSWIKEQNRYPTEIRSQIIFMMDELHLPNEDGKFSYKNEWIYTGFALENSMVNIMESWKFEQSLKEVTNDKGVSLNVEDYIDMEFKKVKRKALNKGKSFKNTPHYPYFLLKQALDFLNEVFIATPSTPYQIPYVTYPISHHFLLRTMEEQALLFTESEERKRYDTKTIDEKALEKYLYRHLEKVEKGLRYIQHQFVIPDGRIDILAKDENDIFVILELKVVEDKDLIWQCMYYPEAIKRRLGAKKVRMITICPSYSPSLLIPLKQLPHVEIMQYTPLVKKGIIIDLKFKKVIV